ncbi:MAG: hypothetical protein NC114_11745 [Ruminococcus flavefaciens]|nr:hypothetical protein [Ruminococcus flavefaciens]
MIGASRIKFEVLDKLYQEINTSKYRMGVVYVDAHSIFYRLYRDKNIANIYVDTKEELVRDIVVGFMNVLGHYRRYLATRLHLDNDIYVVFNRELPKYQAQFCPEFNSKLYKRYSKNDTSFGFVNEAIEVAWNFILGLSPYFEGIYCINNQGIDDFSLFAKLGFQDDIFYTIYSKSMFATQLLQSNVVQLYNRRDDSRLITKGTCYKNGILYELKTKADPGLTPDMLPLLWAFAGCGDVSVKTTKYIGKISTMIKIANQMIKTGDLVPGMSIQSFLDALPGHMPDKKLQLKVDRSYFIDRYRAMSAHMGAAAITSDQIARVAAQCYDIYNETELEQMNELLAAGAMDPELLEIMNLNMSEAFRYD